MHAALILYFEGEGGGRRGWGKGRGCGGGSGWEEGAGEGSGKQVHQLIRFLHSQTPSFYNLVLLVLLTLYW